FYVNGDGYTTGILARPSATPKVNRNIVQYKRTNGKLNWSIADHFSMRSDAEKFVVGSTYAGDHTWGAFEDEIYIAYLNGSGFVRLGHTYSAEASSDSGWRYYAQPRAVVDRQGRYVVFTSDLGSSKRTDVMILKIPNTYWPTPVAPATGNTTN